MVAERQVRLKDGWTIGNISDLSRLSERPFSDSPP